MKKRVLLWMSILLLWGSSLFAQDVPVGVVVAFKQGNSVTLGKYLGDKVEVIIEAHNTATDRDAAEAVMAEFFSRHRVKQFEVNHQGQRNESSFVIGTLVTADGDYRVNCFFRRVQNKYVIHQIRIDKTNG